MPKIYRKKQQERNKTKRVSTLWHSESQTIIWLFNTVDFNFFWFSFSVSDHNISYIYLFIFLFFFANFGTKSDNQQCFAFGVLYFWTLLKSSNSDEKVNLFMHRHLLRIAPSRSCSFNLSQLTQDLYSFTLWNCVIVCHFSNLL